MCFFLNRQNEFKEFFSQQNDLVFCNEVFSFIESLGHQSDPTEWRLCIDPSEICLKAVLDSGYKFPSVLLAHATNMKGSHENINLLLEKIRYEKYN
jgi:hypothetical protein